MNPDSCHAEPASRNVLTGPAWRIDPQDVSEGGRIAVTPIRDKSDVAAALAQPRAFLFLWVNWAVHTRNSRLVVEEVVATWQSAHPEPPVPCYFVDVSDQAGEVWHALADWLKAEGRPAGNLLMGGSGPLLFVRSGHVVLHILAPLQYGTAKLVAASRSAFAPDADPQDVRQQGEQDTEVRR
jgi:hypothetical protein